MISKMFKPRNDESIAMIKWSLSQTGELYSISKRKRFTVAFDNKKHMNRWIKNHYHLIENVI